MNVRPAVPGARLLGLGEHQPATVVTNAMPTSNSAGPHDSESLTASSPVAARGTKPLATAARLADSATPL